MSGKLKPISEEPEEPKPIEKKKPKPPSPK